MQYMKMRSSRSLLRFKTSIIPLMGSITSSSPSPAAFLPWMPMAMDTAFHATLARGINASYCEGFSSMRCLTSLRSIAGNFPGSRFGFATTSEDDQGKVEQHEKKDEGATDETNGTESKADKKEGRLPEENSLDSMSEDELKASLKVAREELAAEKTKSQDLKENLLRTLADMENLRDRTKRQTEEARQFAVQGLVKSLVEVADNLERAAGSVSSTLEMVDKGGAEAEEIDRDRALSLLRSLRDGVLLTDSILMRILGEQGVKRYNPLGQKFDPNFHNALFEIPDGTKDAGTIAVVVKKGYLLHDRAVRAADVGVVREDSDDS